MSQWLLEVGGFPTSLHSFWVLSVYLFGAPVDKISLLEAEKLLLLAPSHLMHVRYLNCPLSGVGLALCRRLLEEDDRFTCAWRAGAWAKAEAVRTSLPHPCWVSVTRWMSAACRRCSRPLRSSSKGLRLIDGFFLMRLCSATANKNKKGWENL